MELSDGIEPSQNQIYFTLKRVSELFSLNSIDYSGFELQRLYLEFWNELIDIYFKTVLKLI